MIHSDTRLRIIRPSGTYVVEGMKLVDIPVGLTFPIDFDGALAGVTVRAIVFADREQTDRPLWCDFIHPVTDTWRSVFAKREWIVPLDADGNPPDVHDPGTHAMPMRFATKPSDEVRVLPPYQTVRIGEDGLPNAGDLQEFRKEWEKVTRGPAPRAGYVLGWPGMSNASMQATLALPQDAVGRTTDPVVEVPLVEVPAEPAKPVRGPFKRPKR